MKMVNEMLQCSRDARAATGVSLPKEIHGLLMDILELAGWFAVHISKKREEWLKRRYAIYR